MNPRERERDSSRDDLWFILSIAIIIVVIVLL